MKHGLKKFTSETQGGRTNEGRIQGEGFIKFVLDELNIKILDKKFKSVVASIQLKMTPDFVVQSNNNPNQYILIESKYKQIAGSDWEKLESNWGFHSYFYNTICKENTRTVVILFGFWEQLQKNQYPVLIQYAKEKYGENCIFDFGKGYSEILRFANFMGVDVSEDAESKIKNKLNEALKIE